MTDHPATEPDWATIDAELADHEGDFDSPSYRAEAAQGAAPHDYHAYAPEEWDRLGAAPRAEGLLREAAIQAWLRLYAGNDIDVAADVGRFFDYWIAPTFLRAAPRAEGLAGAIRAVTEYTWGLHLAGTPNEAEAIALIENLREVWAAGRE